jgi:hypothetical protein
MCHSSLHPCCCGTVSGKQTLYNPLCLAFSCHTVQLCQQIGRRVDVYQPTQHLQLLSAVAGDHAADNMP